MDAFDYFHGCGDGFFFLTRSKLDQGIDYFSGYIFKNPPVDSELRQALFKWAMMNAEDSELDYYIRFAADLKQDFETQWPFQPIHWPLRTLPGREILPKDVQRHIQSQERLPPSPTRQSFGDIFKVLSFRPKLHERAPLVSPIAQGAELYRRKTRTHPVRTTTRDVVYLFGQGPK